MVNIAPVLTKLMVMVKFQALIAKAQISNQTSMNATFNTNTNSSMNIENNASNSYSYTIEQIRQIESKVDKLGKKFRIGID